MDHSGRRELESSLENLERLSNEDHDKLKKKVYETFSGISFLIMEAKKREFKKGWASELVDRHDEKMFEKEEARILEDAANKYVRPMFSYSQKGGVPQGPVLKESAAMSAIKAAKQIDPEQISMDKTFWKIRDMLRMIDSKAKMYARELGPFRFFYDRELDFKIPFFIPTANPPYFAKFDIPIPPRSIPIVIGLVIETVRLVLSVGPHANVEVRKILSLVLGLIDILKGDWKQGILSLIGFYGESPLIGGLIAKVFLNMLDLIAPDLQERIVMDLYQSGKSLCIGFILWGFANFAPDYVRMIARAQFDKIKELVNNANGEIDKIEGAMQKSVAPAGLQIKLKDIPPDFVPTFDDIQNLQAIVRQPTIYCSKEFQEAILPLHKVPPIRLVLELMSIPTDPQTLASECKDQAGESLDDTIKDIVTPEITPDPNSPLGKILEGPQMPQAPQMPKMPQVPRVKLGGTRHRKLKKRNTRRK